jgi:hypothetical protein
MSVFSDVLPSANTMYTTNNDSSSVGARQAGLYPKGEARRASASAGQCWDQYGQDLRLASDVGKYKLISKTSWSLHDYYYRRMYKERAIPAHALLLPRPPPSLHAARASDMK